MKTIHIDGSVLSRQIASGISNYLINIYICFNRYEGKFNVQTKIVALNKLPHDNIFFKNSGLHESEFDKISLAEFIRRMVFKTDQHCSIYHSPYMFLPPRTPRHINVLTVHDLINLKYAQGLNGKVRKQILVNSIRRADYFICISDTTKRELLNLFPFISESQLFVIYQGIDQTFFESELLTAETSHEKPYLLYVGQRSRYKNFQSIVTFLAHTSFRERIKLVCVGGGSFSEAEKKEFQRSGLSNAISHTGYISNDELKNLYNNATALVYPSLEEGFGLPIVEAMACGCPVITGNFSSMKEVAGSHGILVNDYSVDSLSHGVEKAFSISGDQLNDAKAYAKNFTWEKTALNTLRAYSSILSNGR